MPSEQFFFGLLGRSSGEEFEMKREESKRTRVRVKRREDKQASGGEGRAALLRRFLEMTYSSTTRTQTHTHTHHQRATKDAARAEIREKQIRLAAISFVFKAQRWIPRFPADIFFFFSGRSLCDVTMGPTTGLLINATSGRKVHGLLLWLARVTDVTKGFC